MTYSESFTKNAFHFSDKIKRYQVRGTPKKIRFYRNKNDNTYLRFRKKWMENIHIGRV